MEEIEDNRILKQIGNNIKIARVLKGYTQEYVANRLDCSTTFISLVELGKSGVGIKNIIDICNILEIDSNAVFNGTIKYNDSKDKIIINSLSSMDKEDKEIVINLIEYIINKGSK